MAFNYTYLENPFVTVDPDASGSGAFAYSHGIGVTLPFNTQAGGVFNKSYLTDVQVKSNIVTLFSTKFGERLYHIDFGTDLDRILFEQITDTGEIQSKIRSSIVTALDKWTPYVTLRDITITTPDTAMGTNADHAIKIDMVLLVTPTQTNLNVVIFISEQGTVTVT